jgi:hypothetical protein
VIQLHRRGARIAGIYLLNERAILPGKKQFKAAYGICNPFLRWWYYRIRREFSL